MKTSIQIRIAHLQECNRLTAIALESKAHWGYSSEFIESCRQELTVTPAKLNSENFSYYVAMVGETLIGFYALQRLSPDNYELDALFVAPAKIGLGIGRLLVEHAKAQVLTVGGLNITIQGDPNARDFYLTVGAEEAGQRESQSIPGRNLPMFSISLERPENSNA
jgi:GNAT superfamily N-acetyltransferase